MLFSGIQTSEESRKGSGRQRVQPRCLLWTSVSPSVMEGSSDVLLPRPLLALAVYPFIPELLWCFHWACLGPQSSLQSVDLTKLLPGYPRDGCVPDFGENGTLDIIISKQALLCLSQHQEHVSISRLSASSFPTFLHFHSIKSSKSHSPKTPSKFLPLCFCPEMPFSSHFTVPGAAILHMPGSGPSLTMEHCSVGPSSPLQESEFPEGGHQLRFLPLPPTPCSSGAGSAYICWSKAWL